MSVECSECEHDLRTGHEEGCSRCPRCPGCGAPLTIEDEEIGYVCHQCLRPDAAPPKVEMTRTTVDEAKAIRETVRHLEGMNIKQWRSDYGNLTFGDIDRLCRSYLKLLATLPSDAAPVEWWHWVDDNGDDRFVRGDKFLSNIEATALYAHPRPDNEDAPHITMTKSYLSGRQCCDFTIAEDDSETHEEGCPWRIVDEFATDMLDFVGPSNPDLEWISDRVTVLVEEITCSPIRAPKPKLKDPRQTSFIAEDAPGGLYERARIIADIYRAEGRVDRNDPRIPLATKDDCLKCRGTALYHTCGMADAPRPEKASQGPTVSGGERPEQVEDAPGGPTHCTGVSAAWCPVHGDCVCVRDGVADLDNPDCPLHRPESTHAEVEDAPGGPWEVIYDGNREKTTVRHLNNPRDPIDRTLRLATEPEAIAVRDALNREVRDRLKEDANG